MRWGSGNLLDADVVIAASSFTRKSLMEVGVRPEKIRIVPYGVDGRIFGTMSQSRLEHPRSCLWDRLHLARGLCNCLRLGRASIIMARNCILSPEVLQNL